MLQFEVEVVDVEMDVVAVVAGVEAQPSSASLLSTPQPPTHEAPAPAPAPAPALQPEEYVVEAEEATPVADGGNSTTKSSEQKMQATHPTARKTTPQSPQPHVPVVRFRNRHLLCPPFHHLRLVRKENDMETTPEETRN